MRYFAPMLLVTLVAGCASTYKPPADLSTSVPATFVNRGPGAGVYVRASPEECSTTAEAGFIGVVGRHKINLGKEALEKKTRLRHSQPSTISMGWWDVGPIRECGEKITFVPQSNAEYEIEFVSTSTTSLGLSHVSLCSVVVRDRALGSLEPFKLYAGEVARTRQNICIR